MAVNLPANIIIDAKTTSGFDAIGGKLMNMGSLISQFSDKVLDFEKDSVEVYKNYETVMLEAEGALTTQYKSATQRARVMEELEAHVSEWAANSIFHTDDMAKAVSEAAHAGWSLEEMVEGIPVAMNLAQAGSLSLSEGLDDLIKTLNATGMGTEYASQLVDQWTMAANSSATTVGELGEALTKMGATARFADSTEELMAMLAVLADTGTVGTNAGTMLRNSMLRLVAPTTKAEDAMSLLGADVDELNDVLSDKSVTKAVKDLQGMGFSAYTSNGKLKPMVQIFKDLDKVLNGLDEAARNEILAAIFPTRTTTAALAFLDAANGKFDELMESMKDSEGYAGRIAEIQTSGLMGSTELLLSKEEELKRRVGDVLSEPIQRAQGFLGDVLDGLNAMPTEGLSALTGAATALGLAGPGIMLGGIAIKAIAAAGPWGMGFIVAAMGAGALYGYLTKISEINFESNFGTMELDLEALNKEVAGVKTKFDLESEALTTWKNALSEAQTTYTTLATEFAETLATDALTGKELTKGEKEALKKYAGDIVNATMTGIDEARQENLTFLDMLFGDKETDEESGVLKMTFDLENAYFDGLYDDAAEVGRTLREQMVAALEDGVLDESERKAIQATVDRLNQINAAISDKLDRQAYEAELHKAGRMTWDSASEYLTGLNERQTADVEALNELYDIKWGELKVAYDDAVEQGKEFEWGGETYVPNEDNWALIEQEFERERQEALDDLYGKYGHYGGALARGLIDDSDAVKAWDFLNETNANGMPDYATFDWSVFKTADLDELDEQFRILREISGPLLRLLPKGSEDYEETAALLGQAEKAQEMLEHEIESRELQETQTAGGVDEYGRTGADYYSTIDSLDELEQIKRDLNSAIEAKGWQYASEDIANWFAVNDRMDELEDQGAEFKELERETSGWFSDYYADEKRREAALAAHDEETQDKRLLMESEAETPYEYTSAYTEYKAAEGRVSEIGEQLAQLPAKGMDYISDLFRRPYLEEMLEVAEESLEKRAAALTEADQPGASEQDREIAEKQKELERLNGEMESADALIAQYEPWLNEGGIAGMCRRDQAEKLLYGEGGTIGLYESRENTQAQITQLQEELAAMQGAIDASGGVDVPVEATGGTEAMGAAMADMQRMGDQGVSVRLRTVGGAGALVAETYAEGGRATEPSIFAEGDTAEWAIPEEHSERTRQLLRQAAEASGFGWDELLSARGGLNSDAGNVTVNTTYAPTINAGDASGVEDVLNRDKARLAQVVKDAVRAALADQRLRDAVEVYV